MWKPFCNSGNLYMLRLEEGENELSLLLTDFLFIWESQFSIETLVLNFKENNPFIEATDCQIKNDLLNIIKDLSNVTIFVCNNDDLEELSLQLCCGELNEYVKSQNIVYRFSLSKKNQEEFKNKVTISAIQTIYFLEKQQKMLLNLVKKKDRELEEYRMEKGDISRSDLKTEKFDSEVIVTKNDELLLNVFTNEHNEAFWKEFTGKNGEVKAAGLSVDMEPWNAKKRKKVIHNSKNVIKKGAGISYKK